VCRALTTSPDTPAPDERLALLLLASGFSLQPLSTDLYLPSLPSLSRYFAVTPAAIQTTLTLFVLGFGVTQLLAGPLSDRYGRRPVALGGYAVYCAASLLCACASSLTVLLVGRLLQAIGCCGVVVAARALVRDSYEPAAGAQLLARSSSLLALAPLIGPVLGGYCQVWLGWRAAFWLLGALSVWFALFARAHWQESNLNPDAEALRPARLLAAYREVASHPEFRAYVLPAALTYSAIFIFIAGSSFAFIDVLGVTPEHYGLCFAGGVSGYLGGTLCCRRWLRRRTLQDLLAAGTTLTAIGGCGLWLAVRYDFASVGVLLTAQFLVMFAHGINQPCAQAGALAPFKTRAGAAAGLLGSVSMAVALGSASLLALLADGSLQPLATLAAAVGGLCLLAGQLPTRLRRL